MRTDAICLSFSRQFLRCLPRFATQVNRFADSDVSRAPEAQRMSFVTLTLQRTLARVPHIFTFPHHRKRHGRHGGHLPQARVQPLPVRPRLHRAVHTVRHTPLPLSFARKRARRAWPPDFPSRKTAAARVSGARDAAYRWRETRTSVLRRRMREIRASPPATVPNTTRDSRCRRPILRGKTRAFFSARRETSRGFRRIL